MTLLKLLYNTGQRTLTRVDLTHAVPVECRRLDAVARFLEYAQICLAMHMGESKISIASNKLKYGDDATSAKAKLITNAIEQLQQISTGDLAIDVIYDRVFAPYGMPPLKSDSHSSVKQYHEAVNNWVAVLPAQTQELAIDALEILRNPLGIGGCSAASDLVLSNMTQDSISLTPRKYHDILNASYNKLEIIHARALQDQSKILHLLCSDEFPAMRDMLLDEERIELVFANFPSPDGKDLHAEMNLMAKLIASDLTQEDKFYIGISKLSCFGCFIDLSYLSALYPGLTIRGVHAVEYSSRAPSQWHEDTSAEHEYYQPAATEKTNDEFLFAENSDSEGEDVEAVGEMVFFDEE